MATTTLLDKIRAASIRAVEHKALFSIDTQVTFMQDSTSGINFVIRKLESLKRKENETKLKKAGETNTNPFLPYDPNMFVEHVSPTHVILLNKFNVVADHILIVTRKFEPQSSLLNKEDFVAMQLVMKEIDGLAFYNAGRIAGASQPHKHLQMVPLPLFPADMLADSRTATTTAKTPVCDVIAKALLRNEESVCECPELPFLHAISSLSFTTKMDSIEKQAELLVSQYHSMLHYIQERRALTEDDEQILAQTKDDDLASSSMRGALFTPFPYNLLATREWMMIVPRRREFWDQTISVNSLGFAGAVLVKTDDDLEKVRMCGPMKVLQYVGFARH